MQPSARRKDQAWSFRAVGAFIARATEKARDKHGLHLAEIMLNWPSIVGPELAAFTAPRRIRWPKAPERGNSVRKPQPGARAQKTTLEIWVSGGRAHEIPYLKANILSRLNAYFGYRAITELLPVDGPVVLHRPRPKAPRILERDIAAVATAHALPTDDALGRALAKLGAGVKNRAR